VLVLNNPPTVSWITGYSAPPTGKGLHSSTYQLNLSTFMGYVWCIQRRKTAHDELRSERVEQGELRSRRVEAPTTVQPNVSTLNEVGWVYSGAKMDQVELRSGRVEAPADEQADIERDNLIPPGRRPEVAGEEAERAGGPRRRRRRALRADVQGEQAREPGADTRPLLSSMLALSVGFV